MGVRRTVHIPIVTPGGAGPGEFAGEDRLIEVYTQHETFDLLSRFEEEEARRTDLKARDKDWDRVAAPLRKVGLYQAGCAAASAVRKLGVQRPLSALYQQVSRLAWIDRQRLHAATPQGPTEGRSAELGLALVLLMCAAGSRERQIIATGALGGQPRGVLEDDVEVQPVGSLPEKLRLVLELARQKALPGLAFGRELLFFTPRRFQDAAGLHEVAELPEVDELAAAGVRVRPIERLGEAAGVLKARRARHLVADRVAAVLLLCLVVAGAVAVVRETVQQTHVPMTFVASGGAALDPEPFEACFTADGGYYPIPLARQGLGHLIPTGATLGWRVQVGTPQAEQGALAAWLAPEDYYIAQVIVSEHSPAKVMVPQPAGAGALRLSPGEVWEWGWKLNQRAESNGLVLLARPDAPFDPDRLRQELIERFPEAAGGAGDGALDVTAALNFMAAQAPGAVRFIVQTVEDASRCQT